MEQETQSALNKLCHIVSAALIPKNSSAVYMIPIEWIDFTTDNWLMYWLIDSFQSGPFSSINWLTQTDQLTNYWITI